MRLAPLALLCALATAPLAASEPLHVGGRGEPVLLVVGPEADEGLYLWPDGGGLGRFLARRGFDVWIATASGLPDSIAAVLEATGAPDVALVGHGLGGTACYRYLASQGADVPLRAIVTLGAPAGLESSSPMRQAVFDTLGGRELPRYSLLSFEASAFPEAGGDLFAASLTRLRGERLEDLRFRAREAGATVRAPAMADLPAYVEGAAALPAVDFPVLAACGGLDRIAPCEEAWRARDLLGGTFHKFGYMNLDGLSFGHLDLVLTEEARRRVFPEVARFLRRGDDR